MKHLIFILPLILSCSSAEPTPTVPNVHFPWNGYATGSLFVSEAPRGPRGPRRMPLPNLPLHPKLVWDPIVNAARYEVQMTRECDLSAYADCAFQELDLEAAIEPSSIEEAPFRPEFSLPVNVPRSAADGPGGSRYFWRVRACPETAGSETDDPELADGCWDWSDIRYLFVGRDERDTNGDGYADLIVGATGTGTNAEGQQVSGGVYIYFGSADGIEDLPDLRLSPGESFENVVYGHSVSSGRDLNGDGYADVIVGAIGRTDEAMGAVFVHFGSPAGPSPEPDLILRPEQGSQYFGWRVKGPGDLNGDGYADILVSSAGPTRAEGSTGDVYVFYGSETGPRALPDLRLEDPRGDRASSFGFAIDGGGDINGDGFVDAIIGAPTQQTAAGEAAGAAFVFYGSPDGLSPDSSLTIDTPDYEEGARFGDSVACDGDTTGDGYADIWITASELYVADERPEYSGRGVMFLYHGESNPSATRVRRVLWGMSIDGSVGPRGLSYVGDVNGDGYDDVALETGVIGPVDMPYSTSLVLYGEREGAPGVGGIQPPDLNEIVRFGAANAGVDLNADGYADLIASDPGYAPAADVEGQVCVREEDGTDSPSSCHQILTNPLEGPMIFGAVLD